MGLSAILWKRGGAGDRTLGRCNWRSSSRTSSPFSALCLFHCVFKFVSQITVSPRLRSRKGRAYFEMMQTDMDDLHFFQSVIMSLSNWSQSKSPIILIWYSAGWSGSLSSVFQLVENLPGGGRTVESCSGLGSKWDKFPSSITAFLASLTCFQRTMADITFLFS